MNATIEPRPPMVQMDPDIKQQWVAALRSGEYVQGQGMLAGKAHLSDDEFTYCCLGVLCDLAVKAEVVSMPFAAPMEDRWALCFHGSTGVLPEPVIAWASIAYSNPDLPIHDRQGQVQNLALLNDDGVTFEQIADIIEAFL